MTDLQLSPADRFVDHPRHKACFFSETAERYIVNGQAYDGLLKTLSKAFYPNAKADHDAAYAMRTSSEPKAIRAASRSRGRDRGKCLHSKVEEWGQRQIAGKAETKAQAKKHPYVVFVNNEIKKRGLRVVATERLIWDEGLRVATEIDLCVVNPHTGRLVIVELKFGFEGYHDKAPVGCNMQGLLKDWPNTARNQWQLQNLIMTLIVVKRYGIKFSQIQPEVWWVSSRGVTPLPLDPKTVALGEQIYTTLAARTLPKALSLKLKTGTPKAKPKAKLKGKGQPKQKPRSAKPKNKRPGGTQARRKPQQGKRRTVSAFTDREVEMAGQTAGELRW